MDPFIPIFAFTIFVILLIAFISQKMKQPHVVTYLLAGFLLGPSMLGVIENQEDMTRIGSFGVLFLLFFIGMNISPKKLAENWLISIVGTLLQVFISLILVALLGIYLEWTVQRIFMLGCVISLSSTAVVLKLLEDWNELDTRVGQDVVGILLVQDILVVPMLICLNFLGGTPPSTEEWLLQVIGGAAIIALAAWIVIKDKIHIPFLKHFKNDHELQVFASLAICFGMSFLVGFMNLSSALGAFVGGMIVGAARETLWIQQKLHSFQTIFMAIFFVSIGMLIDIHFVYERVWVLLFLVAAALATNTLVNAAILKLLGESWSVSIYGGSLLAQIGEFSFVLALIGYHTQIIRYPAYQMTIAVIALTLLLSPVWIYFIRQIMKITEKRLG